MTRLLIATTLLSLGACATPGKATVMPAPRYELCNDPSFQCGHAAPTAEETIQVDTNFATARPSRHVG